MIEKIILIAGVIACVVAIAIQWTHGIDYMKKNHPDYKGDDFLNS